MKAIWNDTVVAESQDTVVVEGNHYFPADSIRPEFFLPSTHETFCGWKGTARYYDLKVGDAVNANAAWYYPEPMPAAEHIQNRIAFWNGVSVVSG